MTNFPRLAVLTAGGLGTRLRPITYEIPKPLMPVQGKAIIEHVIDEAVYNGIERVVLMLGYRADMIIKHLSVSPYKDICEFVTEKKELGTGGAIKNAQEIIMKHKPEDFFIINGDQLMRMPMKEMYDLHKKERATATVLFREEEDVTGYGVAVIEKNEVMRFVEKPKPEEAPSHTINAGLYLLNKKIFSMLPEKEVFSLERDFFSAIAGKKQIYGYVKNDLWLTSDDFQRYERAIMHWKPREKK